MPSMVHEHESSARAEAERLAQKELGKIFHVLELKASARVPSGQVAWVEYAPTFEQERGDKQRRYESAKQEAIARLDREIANGIV